MPFTQPGAGGFGSATNPYALADVMPLGDSITYGGIFDGGWRKTFFTTRTDLSSAGSQTFPTEIDRWVRHEGHSGFTTSAVLGTDFLPRWLDGNPARNYIIHLGSANIFFGDTDSSTYAANIVTIVNAIVARRPTAKILVAKIILWKSTKVAENLTVVNFRAAMVTALSGNANVTVVDMPVLLDTDYDDDLHPNAAGYVKMGNAFVTGAATAGF